MRILIVDNNMHIGSYPQGFMIRSSFGLKDMFHSIVRKPVNLGVDDYDVDRVILTGSASYVREEKPWMVKEREYISYWMKKKIPILGICFGAQLLARHIFGKNSVTALPVPISGSVTVHFKKDCPIFKGLPNPLGVVSTHHEGFVAPEKYTTAGMPDWRSYAFWYPPNVYGLQFHPELMGVAGRTIVKIQRRIYDRHVYQDFSVKTYASHGRMILRNFLCYS